MRAVFFLLFMTISSWIMAAPIKIIFWHSMTGNLGIALHELVNDYNQSQSRYRVILRYKGDYFETLNTMIAAFRANQQPDLIQVFEAGTATLTHPHGAIMPMYEVMKIAGETFHPEIFIPAIHDYYSDKRGRLLAMPFNASTAVMYFNKNAFIKAGLNPKKPPQTWPQVYRAAKRLLKAGYQCGFTTTWPSWIQIESFSAWHDLPLANHENGMQANADKLMLTNPTLVHHIDTLARWQSEHVFQYAGRADSAQVLFTNEHCPILFQSSGALVSLKKLTRFKVGVAALPYWPQRSLAPRTTLVGGGAIWAMSGKSTDVYFGIADFVKYLARARVEYKWQQATGYLPITQQAYEHSKSRNYYHDYPGAEIAIDELIKRKTTVNSRGLRLGSYARVRDIMNMALESAWAGSSSTQAALARANHEANLVLERFKKSAVSDEGR